MEKKDAWKKYSQKKEREKVMQFAEDYRKFISENKTERECAQAFYQEAKRMGFLDLDELIEKKKKPAAGDKIIANNMGKGIAMFIMGKRRNDGSCQCGGPAAGPGVWRERPFNPPCR